MPTFIQYTIVAGIVLLALGCSKPKPKPATDTARGPRTGQKSPDKVASKPRLQEFQAKVMKIVDGDTLKVIDRDFQTLLVQLNGVDAPELPQAFGKEARDALEKRLEDKIVRVVIADRDQLDRIAGEVYEGDESVNVWIIRQGFGWYNHKYDTDKAKSVAESDARADGNGLWAGENPTPPWVWKNPPDDGRLYIQGNGTRYHCAHCETLDGRRQPISLEDAIQKYKPCQRCKPPTE